MLMRDGHFDYGNGFHGRVYLNPHQLFRHPSTIWRLAQDLLDVLPGELLEQTDVVAGPATGGALLAHTLAGLLDGRRALTHPPCSFAPFTYGDGEFDAAQLLRAADVAGKRVLLADDVRNTGKTFERCAELVERGRRHRDRDRRDLRSHGGGRRRSACRTTRSPSTRRRRTFPPPSARCAAPASRSRTLLDGSQPSAEAAEQLALRARSRSITTTTARTRPPIRCSCVRPFARPEDREIAGFCAAALAFGRVASVLDSI